MRKQLALGLGLAVMAAPAFASKARLEALGEDIYGSYYVNDLRNVFLNAAQVNNHKDTVTMELGNTTNTDDAAGSPRAEGGVFFGHGNMVYGLYLGSESDTGASFRNWAGITSTQAHENNAVDLFVAGDAGIKWGAALHYSKSAEDEATPGGADQASKQEAMSVKLGVSQGQWQGFANISLANKAEDTNGGNEFKGGTGIQLGGSYDLNDYTLFAEHKMFKGSDEAADKDLDLNSTTVGVGRDEKLNDKATLFTKVSYNMTKCSNESATNAFTLNGSTCFQGDIDTKSNSLPVVIGLEYDAAAWLTLRGSVAQTIMGSAEVDGDKAPLANTTAVNTGATLKFGDFNIDGLIGNGAGNGDNTDGALNTDTIMSYVSMTYKF